jgi:hypothetical protein
LWPQNHHRTAGNNQWRLDCHSLFLISASRRISITPKAQHLTNWSLSCIFTACSPVLISLLETRASIWHNEQHYWKVTLKNDTKMQWKIPSAQSDPARTLVLLLRRHSRVLDPGYWL